VRKTYRRGRLFAVVFLLHLLSFLVQLHQVVRCVVWRSVTGQTERAVHGALVTHQGAN
jgi:hypothetical protein